MRKLSITLPAALLCGSLLALPALAQDTDKSLPQPPETVVDTPTGPTQLLAAPPPKGSPAEAAQLKREHDRAIAAGDHANDPHNPASSDALNSEQLAKAQALGTGPVYESQSKEPAIPRPNIQDTSGVTAGTLPADPDPSVVKTEPPAPAGDSLKPTQPVP
ncbi:hypothetical protein [Asticcacaulis sp. 201]|uniref:hypothetical protein n=1 Tax=Asticcacaulis sp. 201 TaxID=3028787 RepID=UPI0029167C30|nr:hypothetical protein [Asticcacaulis sp. 201]MDV6332811.1 hypothetical protein [Asticcacaulis sp. 201]